MHIDFNACLSYRVLLFWSHGWAIVGAHCFRLMWVIGYTLLWINVWAVGCTLLWINVWAIGCTLIWINVWAIGCTLLWINVWAIGCTLLWINVWAIGCTLLWINVWAIGCTLLWINVWAIVCTLLWIHEWAIGFMLLWIHVSYWVHIELNSCVSYWVHIDLNWFVSYLLHIDFNACLTYRMLLFWSHGWAIVGAHCFGLVWVIGYTLLWIHGWAIGCQFIRMYVWVIGCPLPTGEIFIISIVSILMRIAISKQGLAVFYYKVIKFRLCRISFSVNLYSYVFCLCQISVYYCKISNISCTKSENLSDCHFVLQLPLANPLKQGVKLRLNM